MSTILDTLVHRLREAGPTKWEQIAKEAGVSQHLPRKLVYGDRPNPTIGTIQPLINYFERIAEAGRGAERNAAEPATA
jgi:predicted transcriptional regulator